MYVATYETTSRIIWNALLHNVYRRLVCYLSLTDCPDGIVNITKASGSIAYPESSSTYGENQTKCWKIVVPDAEIYRGIGIYYNM